VAIEFPLQPVQFPSGEGHIEGFVGSVQGFQLKLQLLRMRGLNLPAFDPVLKNSSRPACLNDRITPLSVARNDTLVDIIVGPRIFPRPARPWLALLIPNLPSPGILPPGEPKVSFQPQRLHM
jgi:hypothetical protein